MSRQHHLGWDAIKELSHLDFQIHAHVGLGDTSYCPKRSWKVWVKHSYGKYSGLHDLYHFLKLAQDCLFVRLGMSHLCEWNLLIATLSITQLDWHMFYISFLFDNDFFLMPLCKLLSYIVPNIIYIYKAEQASTVLNEMLNKKACVFYFVIFKSFWMFYVPSGCWLLKVWCVNNGCCAKLWL